MTKSETLIPLYRCNRKVLQIKGSRKNIRRPPEEVKRCGHLGDKDEEVMEYFRLFLHSKVEPRRCHSFVLVDKNKLEEREENY